jgi:hypothetical protein
LRLALHCSDGTVLAICTLLHADVLWHWHSAVRAYDLLKMSAMVWNWHCTARGILLMYSGTGTANLLALELHWRWKWESTLALALHVALC